MEGYVKESTFKVIKDSAGMLAAIIGTSLIIATIWLLILRHFTKVSNNIKKINNNIQKGACMGYSYMCTHHPQCFIYMVIR